VVPSVTLPHIASSTFYKESKITKIVLRCWWMCCG